GGRSAAGRHRAGGAPRASPAGEHRGCLLHLPSSEIPAERGSVETTIVFLDLESFTELTHTKGDEVAMETLTRLEEAVRPLALQHDGKLVKQIGDGLMLAFRRPDGAVAFAR